MTPRPSPPQADVKALRFARRIVDETENPAMDDWNPAYVELACEALALSRRVEELEAALEAVAEAARAADRRHNVLTDAEAAARWRDLRRALAALDPAPSQPAQPEPNQVIRYRCMNGHTFGGRTDERGVYSATVVCPECNATAMREWPAQPDEGEPGEWITGDDAKRIAREHLSAQPSAPQGDEHE